MKPSPSHPPTCTQQIPCTCWNPCSRKVQPMQTNREANQINALQTSRSVFTVQWAFHGLIFTPQLDFYNWADQIHEAVSLDPRLQTSPIYYALATEEQLLWFRISSDSTHFAHPSWAVNSQDSHEWGLPKTLYFILGTILYPFSCLLKTTDGKSELLLVITKHRDKKLLCGCLLLCILFLDMLGFTEINFWHLINVH